MYVLFIFRYPMEVILENEVSLFVGEEVNFWALRRHSIIVLDCH